MHCESLPDGVKHGVDGIVLVVAQQLIHAVATLLHALYGVVPSVDVDLELEVSHDHVCVAFQHSQDVAAVVRAETCQIVVPIGFLEPFHGLLPRYGPMVAVIVLHEAPLRNWSCHGSHLLWKDREPYKMKFIST